MMLTALGSAVRGGQSLAYLFKIVVDGEAVFGGGMGF